LTGALTGPDASTQSGPVPFLCFGTVVQWIGLAAVVYGLSVLIGIVIARGVEAALGWLS
jgi:hypothetical protein